MGGIYESRRWDGLRFHDIYTKFHKDWFRHSKVYMRGCEDSRIHRQHDDLIRLLLFFQNKESRLKMKRRFIRLVSVYPPPHELLNGWTNLYETWYIYHGTWAHFNGMFRKSLPSVCVSVCLSLLSLLGKHIPAAMNTHAIELQLLDASFYMRSVRVRESTLLVLPRTGCFILGPYKR
jgi:hypothetical protein